MAKKATVKNKVNKDEFIELVAAKMNKPRMRLQNILQHFMLL